MAIPPRLCPPKKPLPTTTLKNSHLKKNKKAKNDDIDNTILWHIHGFSTDTHACIFLREPQHVTAIENFTDYDAHNITLFLSLMLIWVHSPSRVLPVSYTHLTLPTKA